MQAYGTKLRKNEFDSQDSMLKYLSKHENSNGTAQKKSISLVRHLCLVL